MKIDTKRKHRLLLGCVLLFSVSILIIFVCFQVRKTHILSSMYISFRKDNVIEYGEALESEQLIQDMEGTLKSCTTLQTKQLGKQALSFVLEKSGYEKTFTLEVEVKDTQAPSIQLKQDEISLAYGTAFDPAAYIKEVRDPVDGELPYKAVDKIEEISKGYFTYTSDVNTKKAKNYHVTYKAVDGNGNTTVKKMKVTVRAAEVAAASKPRASTSAHAFESKNLNELQRSLLSQLSKNGTWSLYAKRFSGGEAICLQAQRQRAASLIKLYIMGAVYEDYDSLCSSYGKNDVEALVRNMITVSDNDAANTLTTMLGHGDAATGRKCVNTYCRQNGYHDTSMGRMLLASTSHGDNYTSVQDCALFLQRVYQGQLPHAAQMLSYLKQQQRTAKIPAGIPNGVDTANKTGELADVENDAALVFDGENSFVLVIMSTEVGDTYQARQNITALASQIYTYFHNSK